MQKFVTINKGINKSRNHLDEKEKRWAFFSQFSSLNIHTKIIETMPLENSPSNRFYSPLFSRRLRPGLKITRGWFDRGRYNTNPNNAKQCGIKGLWGEILQFYHTFVVCHFPPKMGHLMIPLHPFLPVILSFLANGEAPVPVKCWGRFLGKSSVRMDALSGFLRVSNM